MNIQLYRFLLFALALLLAGPAQAGVLIDFDELPTRFHPSDRCADAGPGTKCVTDQYQSLGVTFNGLMLYASDSSPHPASPPNSVVDWPGPGVEIFFADWARPDYVAFDTWTFFFGGVFVKAWNAADQLVADIEVESEATYEKDGYWTTLAPTNIAVLAEDIQRIEIEALYHRRGNLHMDNIYFGDRPPVEVPEPSSVGLLLIAILAMVRIRCRTSGRSTAGSHRYSTGTAVG